MKIDEILNTLSVTDLHRLLEGIAPIAYDTKLSEDAIEWAIDLHNKVYEAFFAATAKTPEESLLKLIELGDDDIGSGSIYGPDALTEARHFLEVAA